MAASCIARGCPESRERSGRVSACGWPGGAVPHPCSFLSSLLAVVSPLVRTRRCRSPPPRCARPLPVYRGCPRAPPPPWLRGGEGRSNARGCEGRPLRQVPCKNRSDHLASKRSGRSEATTRLNGKARADERVDEVVVAFDGRKCAALERDARGPLLRAGESSCVDFWVPCVKCWMVVSMLALPRRQAGSLSHLARRPQPAHGQRAVLKNNRVELRAS